MEFEKAPAVSWEQVRELLYKGGTLYSAPDYDFLVPLL
jgi:hypothetical protein